MRAARAGSVPLVIAVVALAVAGPAAAGVAPTEPLGHEGRWITDAEGRVVVLHGANVVAKGDPGLPAERGFGADDADFLASHGFNTVRLGVDFDAIEPAPGSYDDAFIDAWVGQLPMLAARGIFTLLDLHQDQYARKYKGNGLPNWMAIDDGFPNTEAPFPEGYLRNPALNRAFDNFWLDAAGPDGTSLQDHYREGLRRIAAAAAAQPGLLGYDLFNEPWPGSSYPQCAQPGGCPAFDATLLTDFSKGAIAAIRSEDPTHLAFYEPNLIFDFGAVTWHGDTGDTAAVFSFHDYCLPGALGGPPELDQGCESEEDLVFTNAENHAASVGDALMMTEFAASNDASIHRRLAALADRHMVGWHVWTYANYFNGGHSPNQSLVLDTTKPPRGDNVRTDMLEALARPYPRLVAGTPAGWSFDPATLEFEAAWSTTLPDGSTAAGKRSEVFVPALHYGSGYRVRIAGGEVIGGLGGQRLEVRACSGAARVEIAVEAGSGSDPRACPEQGGGPGGPPDPPAPDGKPTPCPPGNSPTVRCSLTTLADGREALQVVGTAAAETLIGSRRADIVVCGAGDDEARTGRGPDRLRCGTGSDLARGGAGRDLIWGGGGPDTLRGQRGRDGIRGNQGRDDLRGGRGSDLLRALAGGGVIRAGGGADTLLGGSGRDLLRAGGGPDLLVARGGRRDWLRCGRGRDSFRAGRRDRLAPTC